MQKKITKQMRINVFAVSWLQKKYKKKTIFLSKHKNHTNIYSFYLQAK